MALTVANAAFPVGQDYGDAEWEHQMRVRTRSSVTERRVAAYACKDPRLRDSSLRSETSRETDLMNWKLLFAGTTVTCVVLLSTGDCSALGLNARQPAVDHPALMLDSGLWRAGFLTEKGNRQSSDADALLSAQTESQLSSSLVTTRERESSFRFPADAPGNSLFVEMPVVDVAEYVVEGQDDVVVPMAWGSGDPLVYYREQGLRRATGLYLRWCRDRE